MKLHTLFGVLVLLTSDALPAQAAGAPNVVVIVADDLGWRDVGFHDSEIPTPNLDRLAREGVELDRFYVQPTCSPTRAALMTGRSPATLGIVRPIAKNDPGGLPLDVRILPEFFREAGYQTFLTGKWHLGHVEKRYLPHRRGFDHFYGHATGGIGYWDHNHGGGHDWQRNGVTVREEGYATTLITDEALRLLAERDRTRPTLLVLTYNAPHLPNEAPAETVARLDAIPNEFRRLHAGMVSELDTQIGRVLEALEREGMAEDTLVWFTSDNGGLNPSFQPEDLIRFLNGLVDVFGKPLPIQALEFLRVNTLEGGSDNLPLRGGKMTVSEGGMRVPAAVWWPGTLAPGRSQRFMTIQDLLPTLLEATGLQDATPPDLAGRSRWQELRDPSLGGDADPYLAEALDGVALYEGPWKLVLRAEPRPPWAEDPPPELYRIFDDPLEEQDLAAAHPDVVARLRATAEAWPRGEGVHGGMLGILMDPDRFGGPEDREPWAEAAR